MSAIVAIPARLQSTRFPRKVLAQIQGKPMLWHVWHNVSQCSTIDQVLILTDDREVCSLAESWGALTMLTSPNCVSGTDRIASVIDAFPIGIDTIVNVQADEPLIKPALVDDLVRSLDISHCDISTPVYKIDNEMDLNNPNVVKVVRDNSGIALYFSRQPIPYNRDKSKKQWLDSAQYWGHPGIYSFRRHILENYANLTAGTLENIEQLEQLRLLEAGLRIQTVEVDYKPHAVDTPEDLETVINILNDN